MEMSDEVASNCCDPGCSGCASSPSLKAVRFSGNLVEYWGVFIKRREISPAIGTSKTHINLLPTEMLLTIFSYCSDQEIDEILPSVCKVWEAVARRDCLRKRLTLNLKDGLTTKGVRQEISGLPGLLNLRLIQYNDVVPLLEQAVLSNTKLRKLTVINCKNIKSIGTVKAILQVIQHTDLRELTIKYSDEPMLPMMLFLPRQSYLERITKLNLNFIPYIKREDLSHIVRCCPLLEDFRALTSSHSKSNVFFGDDEMLDLIKLAKTLRVLKLDGDCLTDGGLYVLTFCKELRKLCLRNLWGVNIVGLMCLRAFRHLESLSLSHINRVSSGMWVRLMSARYWPDLKKMALVCCSLADEAADCISQQYPDLRLLNLSGCKNVTAHGLKPLIQNCTLLEELSICLTQSDGCVHWITTTAPSIKKIIYHCCSNDKVPLFENIWPSEEQRRLVCPRILNVIISSHNQHLREKSHQQLGCRIVLEHEDLSIV